MVLTADEKARLVRGRPRLFYDAGSADEATVDDAREWTALAPPPPPPRPDDPWKRLPEDGAPSARNCHTTVWTGREMLIWGGNAPRVGDLNDGAWYDPARDA